MTVISTIVCCGTICKVESNYSFRYSNTHGIVRVYIIMHKNISSYCAVVCNCIIIIIYSIVQWQLNVSIIIQLQ